jgi:hypothetical protein
MIRSLLIPVFLTGAAFAQVGGPVLGYVPEGSNLRLLYGLPAAGAIGTLINTGRDFHQIAVSPSQDFAIATAAGAVVLVDPVKNSVTALAGVSANPDMLSVSPTGSAAAFWFTSLGRMQVVTGLPSSPSVATLSAPFLTSTPTALAVSDDGQWAVGLWSAGVYSFGTKIGPLQTDSGVIALAFFHNNHNLALATAARATMITDVGGANQPSILYDYSVQGLSPRGLATSFDNQFAVVADSAGKLVNIAIANPSANIVDCGCSPTGIFGLGGSVFRLNGTIPPKRNALERNGANPELKVFDAAAGAVWIVPPALHSAAAGGRQ